MHRIGRHPDRPFWRRHERRAFGGNGNGTGTHGKELGATMAVGRQAAAPLEFEDVGDDPLGIFLEGSS